jgi:hypothetical protein
MDHIAQSRAAGARLRPACAVAGIDARTLQRWKRIFWKIDYYDRTLTYGSENPADPKQTVRVLTIMLASEY